MKLVQSFAPGYEELEKAHDQDLLDMRHQVFLRSRIEHYIAASKVC